MRLQQCCRASNFRINNNIKTQKWLSSQDPPHTSGQQEALSAARHDCTELINMPACVSAVRTLQQR